MAGSEIGFGALPPSEDLTGTSVVGPSTLLDGRYRIIARIGEGAMGEVYEAIQLKLERPVAIKFLHSGFGQHPELSARFRREAKALAKINHAHVLHAYDHGVTERGQPYLVTELLRGPSLRAWMAEAPDQQPPLASTITVLRQIASALDAVHSVGLIHRDIKPSNVIVTPQEHGPHAKLLDFGIVRPLGDATMTAPGVLGTPTYMSPEQVLEQEDIDARADLYSFGVVAFEALTGQPPFSAQKSMEILLSHVHDRPPSIDEVCPGYFPPALVELVRRLLAKSPAARVQSAAHLEQQLSAIEANLSGPSTNAHFGGPNTYLDHLSPLAEPDEAAAPSAWGGRRPWVAVAAIGFAMTAGLTAWLVQPPSDLEPMVVIPDTHEAAAAPETPSRSSRTVAAGSTHRAAARKPRNEGTPDAPARASRHGKFRSTGPPAAHTRPSERVESATVRATRLKPRRTKEVSAGAPRSARGTTEISGWTATGRPAEIEVLKDGQVLGRGRTVRVTLPHGAHVLVVRRTGDSQGQQRTVFVEPGGVSRAKIMLD